VLGMAAFVYLSRRLGANDYGLYSVAFTLSLWCALPISLLVGGATIPMVAGHEQGRRFANTVLFCALVSGIGIGLLTFACAPWFAALLSSPGLVSPVRIMALDVPLTTIGGVYLLILTGQGRFTACAMAVAIYWVVRTGSAFLLVEQGWGLAGASFALPLASGCQCILGRMTSGFSIWNADRMSIKQMFKHSQFHAASGVAQRILEGLDLLAVKALVSTPGASGLFAAAQNVCLPPLIAYNSTGGVVLEALSRLRRDQRFDEERQLFQDYLRASLIFSGLILAMSSLGTPIAVFLFGSSFATAGPIASVLLFATAFRVMSYAGRIQIAARGEPGRLVYPLFAIVAFAVILYLILAPIVGGYLVETLGFPDETPAFALVAAVVAFLVTLVSLKSAICLGEITFPWLTLVRSATAGAIAGLVGLALPGSGVAVLGKIVAVSVVYALTQLACGEWRLVAKWISGHRRLRLGPAMDLQG